jgi:alkylhydroperoxidase family enzyme
MARVSYITEGDHPELADLIGRFKVGRRGNLINIYRLLLNSPALAETWFVHANTVRWKTELPGRLRELMVIRVGYLNRCAYVLRQHIPKRHWPTAFRRPNARRLPTGRLRISSRHWNAPRSPMRTR